jgi:hypothetical protein
MSKISKAGRARINAGIRRRWREWRKAKAAGTVVSASPNGNLASMVREEIRLAIREEVRKALAEMA